MVKVDGPPYKSQQQHTQQRRENNSEPISSTEVLFTSEAILVTAVVRKLSVDPCFVYWQAGADFRNYHIFLLKF